MKTPSWWSEKGLLSCVMQPLSFVYYMIHKLRFCTIKPEKVTVPVLCVGNVTAGGTGKTPTVIALARALIAMGERPHVISRGYGGSIKESTLVDATVHNAADVGDEPLLIAKATPCWIGCNRVGSARAAIARGATVLLMDDGFQNPSLLKDMSVIVVDGSYGVGNGKMLPAGPLREPLDDALTRADAVLIIGDDRNHIADNVGDMAVLHARVTSHASVENKRYIAFAGIGRPQKFYDTLRLLGAELVETHDFPDHYTYEEGEIEALLKLAKDKNATLITTEKDAIKLSPEHLTHIEVLPIILQWDEAEEAIQTMLSMLMQNGGV